MEARVWEKEQGCAYCTAAAEASPNGQPGMCVSLGGKEGGGGRGAEGSAGGALEEHWRSDEKWALSGELCTRNWLLVLSSLSVAVSLSLSRGHHLTVRQRNKDDFIYA
uniref:Uncharacterized protein n=1 Tax=Knipowitschia caucasica TaxID=637954 RepID=A0AAV2K3J6_KNICA